MGVLLIRQMDFLVGWHLERDNYLPTEVILDESFINNELKFQIRFDLRDTQRLCGNLKNRQLSGTFSSVMRILLPSQSFPGALPT